MALALLTVLMCRVGDGMIQLTSEDLAARAAHVSRLLEAVPLPDLPIQFEPGEMDEADDREWKRYDSAIKKIQNQVCASVGVNCSPRAAATAC